MSAVSVVSRGTRPTQHDRAWAKVLSTGEITTQEDLDLLPTGSIIVCEIAEYYGAYVLTNIADCCSGWHEFTVLENGTIECGDDWTPELPAVVIVCGEFEVDDE